MTQTVQGILTTTSSTGSLGEGSDEEAIVRMAWHETVVTLFQSHGSELLPAALVPNIIEWITNQQHIQALPPVVCQAWHEQSLVISSRRITPNNEFSSFASLVMTNHVDIGRLMRMAMDSRGHGCRWWFGLEQQ